MAGCHIAEAMQIPFYRAFTMRKCCFELSANRLAVFRSLAVIRLAWTRTRAYPHAFAVPDVKMGGSYNYMVSVTSYENRLSHDSDAHIWHVPGPCYCRLTP